MSRICLYFRKPPEKDRWVRGDRYLRPIIRRIIRGKTRVGGIEKVFINLCKGLDNLKVPYVVNLPFARLRPDDRVGILGTGRTCLQGYNKPNRIVAGIGLMTHPLEWPDLCETYPVAKYLLHSEWVNNIYKPYFGDKCTIWPVGIDTRIWCPAPSDTKEIDFLIYNKFHWDKETRDRELLKPILSKLTNRRFNYVQIIYGYYTPEQYKNLLSKCKAMIFLCEHESQGIAYQEALSSNVPILAWDQGKLMDPNYIVWGDSDKFTTSVPYWDYRCGVKFKGIDDFDSQLEVFLSKLNSNQFAPRAFILENLTLEKCAQRYLEILQSV